MTVTIVDYKPIDPETDKHSVPHLQYTLGEAVKEMVASAPDYGSGQLEGLSEKVDKLTDLVAKLADAVEHTLTDDKVRGLISYPLMIKEDGYN